MKELRIDLQDLFQRNLRRLKKEMGLSEIEKNLSKNIEEYIKNSISILEKDEKNYYKNENHEKKVKKPHLKKILKEILKKMEKEKK